MKSQILGLCAAGLLALASSNASAVMISVSSNSLAVVAGTPFDVEVQISGLGIDGAPSLGSFDFDLLYDQTALSFSSVEFGDGTVDHLDPSFGCIPGLTCGALDDSVNGILSVFESSFLSAKALITQPETFTLAIVSFTAVADATVSFSLLAKAFGDGNNDPLQVSVGVNTVPEPGTLLLAAGMLGAGTWNRRRVKDSYTSR